MASIFNASGLTGGVSDQDLDAITGYENNDPCIAVVSGIGYLLQYDATETGAENAPSIIIPDDNSTGTGAWVLRGYFTANDFTNALKTKLDGIETAADVTDATNVAAAGAVMTSGNQNVAGIKTFTSFPVTPSSAPTTDYQVANKKYVDDNAGGGGDMTVIDSNTTYYIETTGNDTTGDGSEGTPWKTLFGAKEYLKDKWINSDVTVTLQIGDGTHDYTSLGEVEWNHPCGDRITITGENTYDISMTSVQSSSGSAGAWSVILNVSDVSNIAANDYVLIKGAANGTKPTFINGCHKVTNVDGGNTRITVTSTHQNATAPSGAVTADVTVIKTMLNFSGNSGIVLNGNKLGNIDKCVLVGDSTASKYGINATNTGALLATGNDFGISGFERGVISSLGGAINLGTVCISSATTGVQATNFGFVGVGANSVVSGHVGSGLQPSNGALVYCAGDIITTGNYYHGFNLAQSGIGKVLGALITTGSAGGYGCMASGYSYIKIDGGITASDNNSGTSSPSVNTQGNEYGYIDT